MLLQRPSYNSGSAQVKFLGINFVKLKIGTPTLSSATSSPGLPASFTGQLEGLGTSSYVH